MAQVDHIDIVSSDSENENEGNMLKDSFANVCASSAFSRELPSRSSTSSLNSKNLAMPFQKRPLLKGASAIIEIIDNDHDHHPKVLPGSTKKGETVNQHSAVRDDSLYLAAPAFIAKPVNRLCYKNLNETTDSNCIEVSGIDFRNVSSQQTESRNLPLGQLSPLTRKFNVSIHNGRSDQISESHVKSYNLVGTNTNAHKVYAENHVGGSDVFMYGQNVNRRPPLKSYNLDETNANDHKIYMDNHLGGNDYDDIIMYKGNGSKRLSPSLFNGEPRAISQTTHGESYDSVGSNVTDHKAFMNKNSVMDGDDVIMYESSGSRLLPPSMMNGSPAKSPVASISESAYHSRVWSSVADHKVNMENHFGRSDDDVIIYERSGSRLLPPSMMNGAPSWSQIASISNSAYLSNVADNKVNMENHFGRSCDDIIYGSSGNSLLTPSKINGALGNSPFAIVSRSAYDSGDEESYPEYDERIVFQAALQDLSQPKVEATLPDGLLTVPLLRHQRIALAWLVQRETTSLHCLGGILADDQGLGKTVSMIALIQSQRDLQSKSAYGDRKKKKNDTFKLKDEEDLEEVMDTGESNGLKIIPEVGTAVPAYHNGRPAAGTLVVCPASILRQWARELNDKVADEAKLSVLIYHGSTRTKNPVELAKYDVVLTTYSIVTNEVPKQRIAEDDDGDSKMGEKYGRPKKFSVNKKRKKNSNADKKERKGKKRTTSFSFGCGSGPLARVSWFRVILDEAQTIKNHRTHAAKACCGLQAKRRWCLSGTPMQNTIDDLYSYFRFLKYHPYAVYQSFCSSLKNPTSRESGEGFKKLQVVLKTILLRRTKETLIDGKPILTLPPKSVCLVKVEFTAEEKTFYSHLEANSCSQFKEYADAGTVNQNYASILVLLLRLRQACDHRLLCGGKPSKSVVKTSLEMAKRLSRDTRLRLLNLLEDSLALCSECSDPPEDAVVTLCGHVFCYQCVAEHFTGDDNLCPAPNCKNHLSADVVFSKATLSGCVPVELDNNATNSLQVSEKSTILHDSYSSSKIRAAMEIIKSNCKLRNPSTEISSVGGDGISLPSQEHCDADINAVEHSNSRPEAPVKTIVFSQWTGMLDLLEIPLNQSGIQYRRLDGAMSLNLRDQAVKEFNTDPKVMVMLMSLKAGNLGLNMIASSHVIIMDLWWNPTTEDQAIDRAHRIGQTRPVTVSRLTISNTVEDRILALQEKKRKLVASAFGEDKAGGSATRLTVEDLRYLFMV